MLQLFTCFLSHATSLTHTILRELVQPHVAHFRFSHGEIKSFICEYLSVFIQILHTFSKCTEKKPALLTSAHSVVIRKESTWLDIWYSAQPLTVQLEAQNLQQMPIRGWEFFICTNVQTLSTDNLRMSMAQGMTDTMLQLPLHIVSEHAKWGRWEHLKRACVSQLFKCGVCVWFLVETEDTFHSTLQKTST